MANTTGVLDGVTFSLERVISFSLGTGNPTETHDLSLTVGDGLLLVAAYSVLDDQLAGMGLDQQTADYENLTIGAGLGVAYFANIIDQFQVLQIGSNANGMVGGELFIFHVKGSRAKGNTGSWTLQTSNTRTLQAPGASTLVQFVAGQLSSTTQTGLGQNAWQLLMNDINYGFTQVLPNAANGTTTYSSSVSGAWIEILPKEKVRKQRFVTVSEPWTTQPTSVVELAPEFYTPYAAAFFPSKAWLKNPYGHGTWAWTAQKTTSGPRDAEGGMRFYADHGGETDDDLRLDVAVPTGRKDALSQGRLTTVVVFKAWPQAGADPGHSQAVFRAGGHLVSPSQQSTNLGWFGGNGYDYTGLLTVNLLDGRWHTVVQSTTEDTTPSVSVDGSQAPTSWTGQLWYVADSSSDIGTAQIPGISAYSGYAEYYHLNGIVALAITLPGIYVPQRRAEELALNPWQIFRPRFDKRTHIPAPVITHKRKRLL
jgi:hypothetical protein